MAEIFLPKNANSKSAKVRTQVAGYCTNYRTSGPDNTTISETFTARSRTSGKPSLITLHSGGRNNALLAVEVIMRY